MCSHCPFFYWFFHYSKLTKNCTKSPVYGRKNENLCHLTVTIVFGGRGQWIWIDYLLTEVSLSSPTMLSTMGLESGPPPGTPPSPPPPAPADVGEQSRDPRPEDDAGGEGVETIRTRRPRVTLQPEKRRHLFGHTWKDPCRFYHPTFYYTLSPF